MRYRVTHRTTYSGSDTVSVGHNQAWLEFRQCDRQQVESFSLQISPEPSVRTRRVDAFGNPVHLFSFSEGYQRLEVSAVTVVSVRADNSAAVSVAAETSREALLQRSAQSDPWLLEAQEFRWPSPRVEWTAEIQAWAAKSFPAGRPLLECLQELTARIHADFTYDAQATTVNTPVKQAFQLRRGVCQDFANLFIFLARLLGVPARYVCGYLYTGPQHPNARMADASHAWVEVYLPEVGWKGFDPTNGVLTQTEHVRVAVGRNYRDATPTSGVIYVGGGGETLSVAVRVTRLD